MDRENIDLYQRIGRGKRIKLARKRANLTQKQLADKLGLATGTIQQYELGKREPSLDTIEEIASVLNISPLEIVTGGDFATLKWAIQISDKEYRAKLLDSFDRLGPLGKAIASERVEELTEIPRYRRQDASAEPPEDTDTTPFPDTPEGPPEG